MLRCPQCGNTYTDTTLRFCLSDGTPLISAANPTSYRDAETVRMNEPVGVTTQAAPARTGMPTFFKVLLALIAVGVVFGSVAVVGGLIYINRNTVRTAERSAQPSPSQAAAAPPATPQTADTGADELQKQLAEIQKMLGDQKDGSDGSVDIPEIPFLNTGGTARVNSPGDGFLALRAIPDTTVGETLAKIPHGTSIKLGFCRPDVSKAAGRSGHWCMASYEQKSGWVFDAWLDRMPKDTKKK